MDDLIKLVSLSLSLSPESQALHLGKVPPVGWGGIPCHIEVCVFVCVVLRYVCVCMCVLD
jgi:hypothetical protein